MKIRFPALLAFALAPLAAAYGSYSFKEPFTRSSPFSPTGEVSLENINGDVEIRAWDRNEILIEGEMSAETAAELKAIDLKIDVNEQRAQVKVKLPKREGHLRGGNTIRASVRFSISVPVTARLKHIAGVNSSITAIGLHGPVQLESVNGTVHAQGLGGDAELKTVNGTVRAEFDRIAADQKLTLRTVNGGVHVTLPNDAGIALDCSVVNGDVDCELPLQLAKRKSHHLSGTIGDGRASLKADAVNGGIRITAL